MFKVTFNSLLVWLLLSLNVNQYCETGFMRAKGFTLLEMIVVVAVAAIVMGYAVPAYNRFVTQNRVLAVASALQADMLRARAEAIRVAANVVVCASSDGSSCSASTAAWGNGWLLRRGNTTGTILAVGSVERPVSATVAVAAACFAHSGQLLTVNASGSCQGSTNLNMVFSDTSVAASRTLVVARYGAVRVE